MPLTIGEIVFQNKSIHWSGDHSFAGVEIYEMGPSFGPKDPISRRFVAMVEPLVEIVPTSDEWAQFYAEVVGGKPPQKMDQLTGEFAWGVMDGHNGRLIKSGTCRNFGSAKGAAARFIRKSLEKGLSRRFTTWASSAFMCFDPYAGEVRWGEFAPNLTDKTGWVYNLDKCGWVRLSAVGD